MKLYADAPARRTRQVVADLVFVLWLVGWVWVGHAVHDITLGLADPGRQTETAALSLSDNLAGARDQLQGLPVVGDRVAEPFDQASSAANGLAEAGRSEVRAVERLAWWLGVSIALIPILVVALFFLPIRYRFARQATAGARFLDAAEDLDLFALRALTRQPLHLLARISDDPAGAWRERDPTVVRALAVLELKESGLRVPDELAG